MSHRVVLISREGMEGWFGQSALKRSDVEVHATSDTEGALQLIIRSDCQVVVAEEWPGCKHFTKLVGELLFSIRREGFQVILLTNSMPPGPGGAPIAHVLPVPCDRDDFDRALAGALGLKSRAGKRHLVRLHLSASSREEGNLGMAVCLVLNPAGMIVESPRPLPLGKTFFWSFQGVPQLHGARVPGRVLRQEATQPGSRASTYAVGFDEGAADVRARIAQYLDGAE